MKGGAFTQRYEVVAILGVNQHHPLAQLQLGGDHA
jgi:hypothetical protein